MRLSDPDYTIDKVVALLHDEQIGLMVSINLSSTPLGLEGGQAIAEGGPYTALRELNLGDTGLGDDGAVAFSAAALPVLEVLRLDQCGIGKKGAEALAKMPLDRLHVLSLAGVADLWEGGHDKPFLGGRGMATLVASPHLAGLTELRVPLNEIGDKGAIALAKATHMTGLRTLDLRANEIGDAGAKAILEAGQLDGVESLDLSGNKISASMVELLKVRFGGRVRI